MDGYLSRVGQRMSWWKGDTDKLQNYPAVEPTREDAQTTTALLPTFTTTHVYYFIPQ